MPGRIAYIMSRFPHLPETFILREMIALEELGWDVKPYPLLVQRQAIIHVEALPWIGRTRRLPWMSWGILMANIRQFVRAPGRYLSTLGRILLGNVSSPKFLMRAVAIFPKAVLMGVSMKAEGIQHVHAHYATHPALAAWIIHRLTGIPFSVTVHAHDIFVERAMLTAKLKAAAFIVSISSYNKEYLTRIGGKIIEEKIQIVHCGIEPSGYSLRRPRTNLEDPFRIVSTGSLQPYKGQRYLLEACRLLLDRGVPFSCQIIGGGELWATLEKQVKELQLDGIVELSGPRAQDEVAGLLAVADCYVQPSVVMPSGKMEGIPVALMEALACELPVVASDLSGIPELIRHEETGLLVPQQDAGALADAVEWVYRHTQQARRLAQAGRGLVVREFNLAVNVRRLAGLFETSLLSVQ